MNRGFFSLFLALLLGLILGCSRSASGVRIEGNCLVVEGEFWRADYEVFVREFDRHPELKCLELRDSPGGSTMAALLMGEKVQQRGMKTVARGACLSACAIVFLGGQPRELGPAYRGQKTFLLLHGSYERERQQIDPALSSAVASWLASRSGGALPPALIAAATQAPGPGGGLYVRAGQEAGAVTFCAESPRADTVASVCRPVAGATAASLGLVSAQP